MLNFSKNFLHFLERCQIKLNGVEASSTTNRRSASNSQKLRKIYFSFFRVRVAIRNDGLSYGHQIIRIVTQVLMEGVSDQTDRQPACALLQALERWSLRVPSASLEHPANLPLSRLLTQARKHPPVHQSATFINTISKQPRYCWNDKARNGGIEYRCWFTSPGAVVRVEPQFTSCSDTQPTVAWTTLQHAAWLKDGHVL